MLELLATLAVSLPQEDGSVSASPFDRVHELELSADDPPLIDGRCPALVVELEVEFSGTLHLWTRPELNLYLRMLTGDPR